MIKSKFFLPFAVACAAMVTGCVSSSSSSDLSATGNSTVPEKISTPEEFMDASIQELYSTVQKVYQTEYFALGIPDGWNVVTFNNAPLDSSISVEKADKSTMVTVRINKAVRPTIKETCDLAAEGYRANGVEFTSKPEVAYGTCIIEGRESEQDVALWLRQYDDDNSIYTINYTGSLENVGELLGYLTGNEKLMQLMVRPIGGGAL